MSWKAQLVTNQKFFQFHRHYLQITICTIVVIHNLLNFTEISMPGDLGMFARLALSSESLIAN